MKSLGLLSTILIFTIFSSVAQNEKKLKSPDEQIIVNKEFDENGNIIKYDSTYIHQWSSDSTLQFPFSGEDFFAGNGFPDLNEFFNSFMTDSAFRNFNFSPFNDEDFFEHFQHGFSDSIFTQNYPFEIDSSFQFFNPDSLTNFPQGFSIPDLDEFYRKYNQFNFPPGMYLPEFDTPEQRQEWEKLLEKHQKEMELLKKKWEQKDFKE